MTQVILASKEITNVNQLNEMDYFQYGGHSYISLGSVSKNSIYAYNVNTDRDELIEGNLIASFGKIGDLQTTILNRGNVLEFCFMAISQLEKQNASTVYYNKLMNTAKELV